MNAVIPATDLTWLHMDRPNNLMHVHGMLWFTEQPDWDAVTKVIRTRMVDRFPVHSRRPREVDGTWVWEDDPEFDLDRHLNRMELADLTAVRAHMASRFAEPLSTDQPLWEVDFIDGIAGVGPDDAPGSVMFTRFHHAMADGIRSVQLLLSLCDIEEGGTPPVVGRDASSGLRQGLDVVRRSAADAVDLAKGLGHAAMSLPRQAVHLLDPHAFEQGLDLLAHPTRLVDAASSLASEGNASVNTVTQTLRLALSGPSVETSWSGTPGVGKNVDWVSGLDLDAIKRVGRAHGGTVNDVVLAVVSRALSAYLDEKGAAVPEISWLVPVSLQPIDTNLPEELGNHFALVFLTMPLGIREPAELLSAIRTRMNRLKHSAEPVIALGLQWLVAETPRSVATSLTNLFANKGVGVLTNVPGPRAPMSLAGTQVAGVLGWAPTSGDQPLSLCIFSYNGRVSIGIAADAGLIPDAHRISELIQDEYDALTEDFRD